MDCGQNAWQAGAPAPDFLSYYTGSVNRHSAMMLAATTVSGFPARGVSFRLSCLYLIFFFNANPGQVFAAIAASGCIGAALLGWCSAGLD